MNNKDICNFIYELGLMRFVRHEGWIYAGVEKPDSIAEHSLRAAQIGYILAKLEGADPYKVSTILLFHDIGEIRIGDIHKVANRYILSNEEKAVADQTEKLKGIGKEIYSMWKEIEERKTKEGIVAKDADLLELIFTALELKQKGYRTDDWIKNAKKKLKTKNAKELAKQAEKIKYFDWWKGLKVLDKRKV